MNWWVWCSKSTEARTHGCKPPNNDDMTLLLCVCVCVCVAGGAEQRYMLLHCTLLSLHADELLALSHDDTAASRHNP
jgi:hypothetical protein